MDFKFQVLDSAAIAILLFNTLHSARQNKAVALSFLSDLDKKKASPVKVEAADLSAPILFKKKTAVQTECTTKVKFKT